eukprot:6181239-Alexandrium_andersonii.AAC.1
MATPSRFLEWLSASASRWKVVAVLREEGQANDDGVLREEDVVGVDARLPLGRSPLGPPRDVVKGLHEQLLRMLAFVLEEEA